MSDNERRRRREARVQRRDELAVLGAAMREPAGRRYLYNFLATCHIYSTSFGTNALNMAFREGERNMGLRLAADMAEAAPDLYLAMLKEGTNERPRSPDDGTDDDGDIAGSSEYTSAD